ncbi:MAG: tetratricopeptide repeat protein [Verrucomicrobiota bacterium]
MNHLLIILILLSLLPAFAIADKGFKAYEKGNFEEAQAAYMKQLAEGGIDLDRGQLHLNLGAAAYRTQDFEGAKHAFGEALLSRKSRVQEQAHYNLGNALFQTGRSTVAADMEETQKQWESAIEHYESALELNPQNSLAQKNLEFVKQQLENLKPPEQQENQNEEEKNDENEDNPDNEDQEDEQNQDPPPDNEEEEEDSPPPPPQPDEPDDSSEDEQSPPPPNQPEERNWSPSDARRILENNADEDKDVKPETMEQFSSEPFRNW